MSFDHISFKRRWNLSEETQFKLGNCFGYVTSLCEVPLRPEVFRKLKQVSLIKGAKATTAIEGNTLSEEEILKIYEGQKLSESKAYQEQEVQNVLTAMNEISEDLIRESKIRLIEPSLLKEFHYNVGKDLKTPFGAVPGHFAQSQRVVGGYRCPPPGNKTGEVEVLVEQLCEWLKKEFSYSTGKQSFSEAIIQSMVTHVYIEWIHPFDDGNGRTGRLVEFYLLLRAEVPDICAHILSNHYNNTRPEYYGHLDECRRKNDLSAFIEYAVTGFLDGLKEVWTTVKTELLERAWRGYVYDVFAGIAWSKKVFKRRRRLLLDMSVFKYEADAIQVVTPDVAKHYANVSPATIKRDIEELIKIDMLVYDKSKNIISANISQLGLQYPSKV